MTSIGNVGLVFSSPGRVAQRVAERPDWKTPVMVIILASIILTLAMLPYHAEAQREMLEKYRKETGREIDVESALRPTVGKRIGAIVVTLIATGLFVVVGAAILNGVSLLVGGRAGFVRMFAFFSYAMIIPAAGGLIKIPLVMLKGSYDVRLSLAAFFPSVRAESYAGILLGSTDLFSIWAVVATAIGFNVLAQLGMKKSAVIVIALYAVFVLILLGFGLLAAGVTGR